MTAVSSIRLLVVSRTASAHSNARWVAVSMSTNAHAPTPPGLPRQPPSVYATIWDTVAIYCFPSRSGKREHFDPRSDAGSGRAARSGDATRRELEALPRTEDHRGGSLFVGHPAREHTQAQRRGGEHTGRKREGSEQLLLV